MMDSVTCDISESVNHYYFRSFQFKDFFGMVPNLEKIQQNILLMQTVLLPKHLYYIIGPLGKLRKVSPSRLMILFKDAMIDY